MYCQLGNIVFDGLKSFVSFGDEKEATIAEHALYGRKPKLQGTGTGLKKLTISLYLHQSFCIIKNEVAALTAAMESFDIMPLLWGNGDFEGNFNINKISRSLNEQDKLGNIYACTVSLELTEVAMETDMLEGQQQQARKNAFATGNKNPASKSIRVNLIPFNQQMADTTKAIKSNAAGINASTGKYVNKPSLNSRIKVGTEIIKENASKLLAAYEDVTSPLRQLQDFKTYCTDLKSIADRMGNDIFNNPSLSTIVADNEDLQNMVTKIYGLMTDIIKASIIRK